MSKKGFTLVELLAVIAILAVLMLIVVPSVINMVDRGKKEKFLADAKELVGLAKYKVRLEKYTSIWTVSGDCKTANATGLGFTIINNPDGDQYDYANSQVKMCIESSKEVYYVKLYSTNVNGREVSGSETNNFVKEINLTFNSVKN